ncbi:hypothetical protein Dimus_016166, partial [Dionaea muscipula]
MKLLGRVSASKGDVRSTKQGLVLAKDQESQSPRCEKMRIRKRYDFRLEQIEDNPSDRLSGRRLTIPHSKMVARYADALLGSSSHGVRRYLSSLPPSHELALVMRNVAELSALSGHSLRGSLRNDVIRRRYRKKIRGVQAEKDRLNEEPTSEKTRLTELATAALQLKADVARISKEKQAVEEENRRLTTELEKEKAKGKRSRERLILLHNDLSDMSLKNETLHNTLDETSGKLIKVQRMLEDDDPLIPELDQMKIDVKVPFQQEEIPKIRKEPTSGREEYDIGILSFVEEWGKEIADMFPMPSMSKTIISPPASAARPHLAELNAPTSPSDNV